MNNVKGTPFAGGIPNSSKPFQAEFKDLQQPLISYQFSFNYVVNYVAR